MKTFQFSDIVTISLLYFLKIKPKFTGWA